VRNVNSHKTKILLLIVTVALIISFSAKVIFFSLQPATLKVEYWLTSRNEWENFEYATVNFRTRLLLQGCDSIMLNAANFTLNDIYHPMNTGFNYPFTVYRGEDSSVILSFDIPADTSTYTLAYHGISNCTFVFSEISG
jgi:hypothetical protein